MRKSLMFAVAFLSTFSVGAETVVPASAVKSLNVTVYNNGLGLIKDTRAVAFKKGDNTLSFTGVSARIQPETALFSANGVGVREQNFNYDLISRESLLQKFLGKKIKVVSTNPATGAETVETAEVLSVDAGLVLKIGDRIETDSTARLIFPDIPENLRDKPTLTLDVVSDKEGPQTATLGYLTDGLSWRADYVAELNDAENAIALNGWVTMTNETGADYINADVGFVAGTVNRVRPRARKMQTKGMMLDAMSNSAALSEGMREEALMDYHLYSLDRKTTILSKQSKQLALLSAPNAAAEKKYVFENIVPPYGSLSGGVFDTRSAAVRLTFKNDKASRLGLPLPEGTVRVYKADSKGRLFFVGEDRIRHTPENETVGLSLGEAFDITASGKRTAFKKAASTEMNSRLEPVTLSDSTFEITFKNAKDKPVKIEYVQLFPDNRTLVSSSDKEKQDGRNKVWTLTVPAKGEKKLTLVIRSEK